MLRPRRVLVLACTFAVALAAADVRVGSDDRVLVPPARTSIYVGTVTLTTSPFVRLPGRYEAAYAAKVFPYFFYNEAGTLSVDVADEMLDALARGEPFDFKGRAVRSDGTERRVEGRATPVEPPNGKLKVRVFVSRRVELIFNTTYRFEPASAGLE
jgi:hypothetical protein